MKRVGPLIKQLYRQTYRNPVFKGLSTATQTAFYPETSITTLENGFRVANEESPGLPTTTVGVYIDAGTRYETPDNNGTAHFLEHMIFKGTKNRSRYELELEVENMGAHLNAYTSREQTVFYAKCLTEDVPKAVDILADVLLESLFQKKDIECERGVILREMEEVEQNLQEVVFDRMHEEAFRGSTLSMTILGPIKKIKSIQREDLLKFISDHYRGPRMALCAAGGVQHDTLIKLGQKYFGHLESNSNYPEINNYTFTGNMRIDSDNNMPHMYMGIAVEGPAWNCPDNICLQIANFLTGQWDRAAGSGVSTPGRLASKVEENQGVLSFQAFSTCYKDTGLWGVYFIAEEDGAPAMTQMIQQEWHYLCNNLTEEELERGKRMLITNLVMTLDGTTPICEDIGRHLLFYGRRITPEELIARIEAVDLDVMKSICRKYLYGKKPAVFAIGKTDKLEDYETICKRMTW